VSWLDDTMCGLLWSFDRNIPRRDWKSTAHAGEVNDLEMPQGTLSV